MTDKRMGDDFAASGGSRELEIFLLKDAERKTFRRMQDEAAKERDDLRKRQEERREKDIAGAKTEIRADKPEPQPTPPWFVSRRRVSRDRDLQARAEALVDTRNEKEARDLHYAQRQREDDFLSKQKEERLLREVADRTRADDRRDVSKTRGDFDKARDRER